MRKLTIEQFLNNGKKLTPLEDNIPRKDWRTIAYSPEFLFNYSGNLGWVLGKDDLVIDIDPRNGGDESFKKLEKLLDISLEPTVLTASKGYHIYLKIPENKQDFKIKKNLKDFPGLDFLHEGCYCLIPDCERVIGNYYWVDDFLEEFVQLECPNNLLDLLIKQKSDQNSQDFEDLGDFEGLISKNSANLSQEKVKDMLLKLDPSMKNDEWVKVGMALHEWDLEEGLELWEEWSKNGDNYQEGETEKRWKSFDHGGGVTLGTISYMVKEVEYDGVSNLINGYIEKIQKADQKTLEFNLIPGIRKEMLSSINKEKLAKVIQDRFKELNGVRLPIGEIRQLISGIQIISGEFLREGEIPSWCSNWVYINSHSSFANLESRVLHKTESFNIKNGKFIPENGNGNKPSASKYVSDSGFIETVDAMAYLPSINESICEIDNFKILNSFNPKTVPTTSLEYSEKGIEAIQLIKKHVKFICSDKETSSLFLQWIAHNVQFPGKQILWSPVIQSIQGVGKSFFGELLRSCLGDRNVGTVSPSQVISDFNGWATGVTVNVLEELRVKGHNRYDAINSLKPLITDRMIQINDKGIKPFMTYNTTNYICFTNYKDSLPLDQDDRRWWVIFVPIEKLEDLPKYVEEESKTYFPKLFRAVRENSSEIRKWFLEYELSEEFLNIKQAPMTNDKLSMIATEEAALEGYSELKELIEKGGRFFNKNVISSSDLFDQFLFEYPEFSINTIQKNRILKKLGFTLCPKVINIDGKTRRIWTKKRLSNDEIRKSIE